MAAINPPFVIQASTHPSDVFRRMVKAVTEGTQGVVNVGDMAVTAHGGTMSVDVAAGQAVIVGTENVINQGAYEVTNDAVVTLTISAADPTNPRWDLVVAKVQDATYSGATNAWSLVVVTGTPAGSPVDPALPANAIKLARVVVPANGTPVVSGWITDLRQFLYNSALPVGTVGLTGATTLTRYAGGTAGGPPTSGTFKVGDLVIDSLYGINWICTTAGTPGTWKPSGRARIDTQTPVAGSFTFSPNPLPTYFKHLIIEWYARGDTAATTTSILLRFNNISTATYDTQFVRGNAATASAAEGLATGAITLGAATAASATANYFSMGSARINQYNSAVGNKSVVSSGFAMTADTTGTGFMDVYGGKWRTTGTPITRLDILAGAGNFVTGTEFNLYGEG